MTVRNGYRHLEHAMKKILEGLNVAQKAAVTCSAPVLQVLAPPGSGKTKTLTSRVGYLLAHEQYAPWNVICCTFTIKASREMRERLRGMIGEELERKLILGTFHSVCRRYLVNYGHLIGVAKDFGVADSDDSLNIIKRIVKRLKFSIDPKIARSRISHRKARGKRLEDLSRAASKSIDAQEFSTVFQEYEDALALSNLLDYDDLLMRCVDLLKQHPDCVSNIEALLIDEFQDTNVIQFELMKLLASAKRRITIVGDPDQSIYGFRSAEIENLRRMKTFYPETVVINLEENYRSASAVLRLAQKVIEQDNDRPPKKLKSTHRYGTLPVLRRLPNPHEEAQWIVSEIKRISAMTGNLICHSDIAILLRSAFLSLLIEKALANAGIPYRMVGGRRFFDRVEVRILLDYLRAVSHPDNTSAFLAIINTPARKIGDTTVKELSRVAEQRKETLWSVSNKILSGRISLDKKLAKPAEQGLSELVTIIQKARQNMQSMKPEEAPGKLIELIIKNLDYRNFLQKQYPEDYEERWENVQELLTQAADSSLHLNVLDDELPLVDGVVQEKAHGPQEVLSRFLANIVLSTEVQTDTELEQKPRITISTIHSAKGLEWPVVFVPAVYEGSIPHSRAEDTNEERRLLYVAMTRAQSLLYMTFPVMQSRDTGESILSQFLPPDITPFVSQIGPNFTDSTIEDIASILRRPAPSQENIAKGHVSIKDNESQNDDIWPEDGSHRRALASIQNDTISFVLQRGQSLSDALKGNSPYYQCSNLSTSTYTSQSSSSMQVAVTSVSKFSNSDMAMNFTTASQHFKSLPQTNAQDFSRPTVAKSTSNGTNSQPKKPKLSKTSSGQVTIGSFFADSGLKPSCAPVLNTEPKNVSTYHDELFLPTSTEARSEEKLIPAMLSSHKLSHGASSFNKRPQTALKSLQTHDLSQDKKRNYSFLSSSPTQEQCRAVSHGAGVVQPKSNQIARLSKPEQEISQLPEAIPNVTSVSTVSITSTNYPLSHKSNAFGSSRLNRLDSLNPLNNLKSTAFGQDMGLVRKTLGVRRSMNGWDNRKNK